MITTKRDFGGIEQLPEGLLLKILCRIPTEHLLKTCRYVCKAWFRLLKHELQNPSFIHSNSLFYDPSCIVFGDWPLDAYIADPTGNFVKTHAIRTHWLLRRLPMSNLNSPDHQFRGRICGSSDGVLLIMLHDVDHTFCVVNPLTMQLVTLPHVNHDQNFGVITRIPDTGKFKVLTYGEDENGLCVWYVTTVGIDMSWKILFGVPSSCNPSNAFLPWEIQSVSVNGIVFVRFHVDPQDFTFAVIDLHNETGYWLEIPTYCRSGQQNGRWNGPWRLMNINNKYLGYTELKKEVNADMDVWVLKELGRNEWSLMLRFSLSNPPRMTTVGAIWPRIWFQSTQVMIVDVDSPGGYACFAYFVEKKEFQKLSSLHKFAYDYLAYGYSLVSLF